MTLPRFGSKRKRIPQRTDSYCSGRFFLAEKREVTLLAVIARDDTAELPECFPIHVPDCFVQTVQIIPLQPVYKGMPEEKTDQPQHRDSQIRQVQVTPENFRSDQCWRHVLVSCGCYWIPELP